MTDTRNLTYPTIREAVDAAELRDYVVTFSDVRLPLARREGAPTMRLAYDAANDARFYPYYWTEF